MLIHAAVAAQPGIPAVPPRPAAPFPSTAQDEEILDAITSFYKGTTLPVELVAYMPTLSAARKELQLRALFVGSSDARFQVIRARFATMLPCFEHLERVVHGADDARQIDLIGSMALTLLPSFSNEQVSSYHALDAVVKRFVYVLDEAGGTGLSTADGRTQRIVAACVGAEQLRLGSASQTGGGGSSSGGGADGSSSAVTGKVGVAFLRGNAASLEQYIAKNQNAFMAALNTAEAGFTQSALDAMDPRRILRQATRPTWGVCFLQFLTGKFSCPSPMFTTVAPHRHYMYEYIANCVAADSTGMLEEGLEGDWLDHAVLDKFLEGKNWDTINFYDLLVVTMRNKRGTAQREKFDETWPLGVFRSATLVMKLRDSMDKLFHAIGYRYKSSTGLYNSLDQIWSFLDDFDDIQSNPQEELYGIYQEFMRNAQSLYNTARESPATAVFPLFRAAGATWPARVKDLRSVAAQRNKERKLMGTAAAARHANAAGSPSVTFGRPLAFADVLANDSIDGRKRARSPSSHGSVDMEDRESLASFTSGRSAASRTASASGSAASARSLSSSRSSGGSDKRGNNAIGCWADRVMVLNSQLLRINFVGSNGSDNIWDFKVKPMKAFLLSSEGSEDMCLACSVGRNPATRYNYCPLSSDADHATRASAAHAFKGTPWTEFGKAKYSSKRDS